MSRLRILVLGDRIATRRASAFLMSLILMRRRSPSSMMSLWLSDRPLRSCAPRKGAVSHHRGGPDAMA